MCLHSLILNRNTFHIIGGSNSCSARDASFQYMAEQRSRLYMPPDRPLEDDEALFFSLIPVCVSKVTDRVTNTVSATVSRCVAKKVKKEVGDSREGRRVIPVWVSKVNDRITNPLYAEYSKH